MSDDNEEPKFKLIKFEKPIKDSEDSEESEEDGIITQIYNAYAQARVALNSIEDEDIRTDALYHLREAFLCAFDPLAEIDKEIDALFEED